ncbi:MAG: GNAT family N-acetyltransferase [Candidatus Hodarchaeota archaeon]
MGVIRKSEWDSEHFGIKVGRYMPHTIDDVLPDIDFAKNDDYDLLIARIRTDQVGLINEIEETKFKLKDAIVEYILNLDNVEFFEHKGSFKIRKATEHDVEHVKTIAYDSFKDYIGHFHKNMALNRKKCDELYVKWAENSIRDKNVADVVFIAENKEYKLGFGTVKTISDEESRGVLFGTTPEARGRGVYTELLKEAINWSKRKMSKLFVYGTQINNYIAQNVLIKLGFKILSSFYTFHLWIKDLDKNKK